VDLSLDATWSQYVVGNDQREIDYEGQSVSAEHPNRAVGATLRCGSDIW
jgi:hypothetical protein